MSTRKMIAVAAIAASVILPARAANFTVTGSGNTFTVTRADTNAAERVFYRTVSRSALAGLHFMGGNGGKLDFAAGERSQSAQITEYSAQDISNPLFLYYQHDGATGSSRTYRFEVVDEGGFSLASADRAISYDASKSVSSSTFNTNSVTVTNGTITVHDTGFAQAYYAVPLANYFSSAVPRDYLAASGANLHILVDLQAAEVEDGYQYIQILADQTTNCDAPENGSNNGDPGTVRYSRYMAGFEHLHGDPSTNFKKYTFPVVSTNNGFGATQPWSDQGNDIGNLVLQRFNTNCRAADGRLTVPASLTTLGIRFTASGSGNDDWKAQSVVARIQAVPSTPSILNITPVVTPPPVCKGATVTISLPFSEIVTVTGTPTLSTSWGDLSYVAGSGANVLTFAGPVTAPANTQLQITGLSGMVKGITGNSFSWSGAITVSGRTVNALPTPPTVGGIYQLSTPAHLRWFADRLETYPTTSAALAADIDLSDVSDFVPMGGNAGFMGTFDGRGHALSGLSITTPDASGRMGLFGLVAAQGVVRDLVLDNVTVHRYSPPALFGTVCGRNLGTVTACTVSGKVTAALHHEDGTGSAMGGICAENAGTVRACRVADTLGNNARTLDNSWNNMTVGGIVGTNTVSGTIESCLFYARFASAGANIVRGAICGANSGTVRNCIGVHNNYNYFSGCVGSDSGTVEDTIFPEDGDFFTGGGACYDLNDGVTDGTQLWYQALGTDSLPRPSSTPVPGATVYSHGDTYCNEIVHGWNITFEPSSDFSNGTWTATCTYGHETISQSVAGTIIRFSSPSCVLGGMSTWAYDPPENDYGFALVYAVQDDLPPPLGHVWDEPVWNWTEDLVAATATFTCSRCGKKDAVPATVSRGVDGASIVGTATATHHDETFTVTESVPVTPWKALQVRLDFGGTVTLTNDVTAADGDATLTIANAVTLDLNGHMIDANGKFGAIMVARGGNLTLTNSVEGTGVLTGGKADKGGGVYVDKLGTFAMTGGEISGNAADYGGGVYVDGSFTVSGSSVVSGNTNSVGAANNVYLYSVRKITIRGLSAGASIGVTPGIVPTVDSFVTFATGASEGDETHFTSDKPVFDIVVEDGSLCFAKLATQWDALQAQLDAGGTVTLTRDVTATDGDTALTITNTVTLNLNGHTLDAAGWIGAIRIRSGGDLTLTNSVEGAGVLTGGNAEQGGGVYVGAGGVFAMTGGTITGDTASFGGGVYVFSNGSFAMTGGTIAGNTATNGCGVYVCGGGMFTVSGSPVVYGNTNFVGAADNVYLMSGRTIAVNGLSAGASFGVSTATAPVSSPVAFATGAAEGDETYFTSDISAFAVDALDGTLRLRKLVTPWDLLQAQLNAGGTVTLTNDVTATKYDATLTVANDVTLDLNGHTLDAAGWFGVILIRNGCNFTLTNGVEGAGVLTGGNAEQGGGVYVSQYSTFTLADGTITGNTAFSGGGVFVYNSGAFVVSGSSVVSGNTNFAGEARNVHLQSGRPISVSGLSAGASFGVSTQSSASLASPVTVATGASAGDEAHFFSDFSDLIVVREDDTLRLRPPFTQWEGLQARLDAGGAVTLTNDVAAVEGNVSLTITNAVTLDLNGHTLDAAGWIGTIQIRSGGDLTLTNSLAAGAVTGGGNHGVYVESNAVFRLQGGTITGNTANNGGGVYVDRLGTFEMTGGEISGNTAKRGGGLYVYGGGTFTMNGGAVSGNTAELDGGGAYLNQHGMFEMNGGEISGNTASEDDGGGVYMRLNSAFTMNGGAVSGNTAYKSGGVYVEESTFTMNGGEITGNAIRSYNGGGGVYVYNGEFVVSGSPVVFGNTCRGGAVNNVYLYPWRKITVDGLSAGAVFGVNVTTAKWGNPPFTIATGVSAGDEAYFFSDNSGFHMERDGNKILLVEGMPEGFRDPQGVEIVDPAVLEWLSGNGFTQADIYALGRDAAGTEKLYEYYMLNCDFRVQDAGATISLTDITVSNDVISVTVQLTRKAPFGAIKGCLYFYAAHDLADGFDRSPIVDTSVDFGSDDPTFATTPTADSVTQTATATFSYISYKFFKAAIHAEIFDNGEEPWEE